MTSKSGSAPFLLRRLRLSTAFTAACSCSSFLPRASLALPSRHAGSAWVSAAAPTSAMPTPITSLRTFSSPSRPFRLSAPVSISRSASRPPRSSTSPGARTVHARAQPQSRSQSPQLPPCRIPIFQTVDDVRRWRRAVLDKGESVGFVPTMGALHQGHLDLVRRSLSENDHTVVSIFVNPAQFAPHEDLASYPRTLETDLHALEALSVLPSSSSTPRSTSAVFLPTVPVLYPSGLSQVVSEQKGAFVEVKGMQEQMEGGTRPHFFRGVATVVTKLLNIVMPTNAYFGAKDIQQALLLRRLLSDLFLPYPPSPSHLHICPTTREPSDGLALSSRNAYLSSKARREAAPALRKALLEGERAWKESAAAGKDKVRRTLEVARAFIQAESARLARQGAEGVQLELDYISLNDPFTLDELRSDADLREGAVLSGATFVTNETSPAPEEGKESGRRTRLIDNLLLDFEP